MREMLGQESCLCATACIVLLLRSPDPVVLASRGIPQHTTSTTTCHHMPRVASSIHKAKL